MTTDDQSAPAPADIAAATETAKRITMQLKSVIRELTGWSVWVSDAGALYATRPRDLSKKELAADLAQTVAGDNARDLIEKIHDQTRHMAEYQAEKTKASAL